MMSDDEYTRVVTGITIVDRSIAHHTDELARNWALRATLAARLEELGRLVPPAPPNAPVGAEGSPQAVAEAWLAQLDATGFSPEPPTLSPQEYREAEKVEPRLAEVQILMSKVMPDGSLYEPLLIEKIDIPDDCTVWIRMDTEAHLAPSEVLFRGVALCGRTYPSNGGWAVYRDEMAVRVELCSRCTREAVPSLRT